MSTPWHTKLHPPPPSTAQELPPHLRVRALGQEHQDPQPGTGEGCQFHCMLAQRVLPVGSFPGGDELGDPQPTALAIVTIGLLTHRSHGTDQLQLWIMSVCSVIFPKRFNSKAPGKAAAPNDCRPRAWHRALTTGSQVAAKDLVDQRCCLGLAIQPRDSSTASHTVPARLPCTHHGVLSTNSWLELRAGCCRGKAASRRKGAGIQVLPGQHADPTVPSSRAGD